MASTDLNSVSIIGRLTKKPDMRYTPQGTPMARFSIANNRVYYDKDRKKNEAVNFFRVIVWGKFAEICDQYLDKGSRVAIQGHLQQNKWQAQDGTNRQIVEIVADKLQFLSGGRGASGGSYSSDFGSAGGQFSQGGNNSSQNGNFGSQAGRPGNAAAPNSNPVNDPFSDGDPAFPDNGQSGPGNNFDTFDNGGYDEPNMEPHPDDIPF